MPKSTGVPEPSQSSGKLPPDQTNVEPTPNPPIRNDTQLSSDHPNGKPRPIQTVEELARKQTNEKSATIQTKEELAPTQSPQKYPAESVSSDKPFVVELIKTTASDFLAQEPSISEKIHEGQATKDTSASSASRYAQIRQDIGPYDFGGGLECIRYRFHPFGPVPFENLGNTCYMNSVLQALLSLPELFLDLNREWAYFIQVSDPLAPRAHMLKTLLRLFTRVVSVQSRGLLTNYPDCMVLNRTLTAISAQIGQRQPEFKEIGLQQDATEFIDILVDMVREELKAIYRLRGMDLDRGPITRWFVHSKSQIISCHHGHRVLMPDESDIALRVYLPNYDSQPAGSNWTPPELTLQALVNDRLSPSEVGACSKPGCDERGVLHTFIERVPRLLLIYLARYTGHMHKRTDWVLPNSKIFIPNGSLAQKCTFPLTHPQRAAPQEQIRESGKPQRRASPDGAHYSLRSIVKHSGSNLDSGHYVSFCWSELARQWFKCDDHSISPTTPFNVSQDVVNSGYCFFYLLDSPSAVPGGALI